MAIYSRLKCCVIMSPFHRSDGARSFFFTSCDKRGVISLWRSSICSQYETFFSSNQSSMSFSPTFLHYDFGATQEQYSRHTIMAKNALFSFAYFKDSFLASMAHMIGLYKQTIDFIGLLELHDI